MDNERQSIPKIIHYCWFGRGKMPDNLQKYIKTWHEKMPEYRIIEWNEEKFDIDSSIDYVKEAYASKKYAFVSDYVRLKALYDFGGIYLDTDIEVIQNPSALLQNASLVTGFETETNLITAFIAAEKHHYIIGEFLNEYKERHFLQKEGNYDQTPINDRFTSLMTQHGLKKDNSRQTLENGIEIYPYTVFCGQNIENSHPQITNDTYTVHRFQASWKKENLVTRIKYRIIVRLLQKILGYDGYDLLKERLHL